MDSKVFHAEIKKRAELDGHLVIEGWASTKNIDRQNEVVEPEAFVNGIDAFMKNPVIHYQHNTDMPIGKAIEMSIKDIEGFWIKAMLSKADDVADIVTKIKEGILRAFSIGFRALDKPEVIDGVRHIKAIELYEVSVVSIPSNREALFSIAKSLQFGSDIVLPYDTLVKDVEELKIKIGAAPLTELLEALNNQPGEKASLADRYAESIRALANMKAEEARAALARFDDTMDRIATKGK